MEESNRRIIKNTIYLYIRQILIITLSLITTRIILEKLGVSNYGIYNVVGGFVALFTILNNVLQSVTRRYLALALGKNDENIIRTTFSTAILIHIFIAIITFVLLETIGLWFLNHEINIQEDRLYAANWVFQFSVLTVIVNITQTPYSSVVTAHEQFKIYAVMSIYDAVAKLSVLFLLLIIPFDALITYAALISLISITSCIIYRIYCIKKYPECRTICYKIDRSLFKEMLRFSGWDSFGNITSIANTQGITILLNIFFNTVINASRGIAATVTTTISQFVTGFIQAAEPKLVKLYATNEMDAMRNLIFNIAQMTLFMLAIIAVPVWLEIEFVLKIWLGVVPEYTAQFIKITIFCCFFSYSNSILVKANTAMGLVKQVTIYMVPIGLIHLPIVYVVLRLGWNPTSVYWVGMIPILLRLFVDLWIQKKYANFPVRKYIFNVVIKNLILVVIAAIPAFFIRQVLPNTWLRFLSVGLVSTVSTLGIMWFFVLSKSVKQLIVNKITSSCWLYSTKD